jgi:hypothetical protein
LPFQESLRDPENAAFLGLHPSIVVARTETLQNFAAVVLVVEQSENSSVEQSEQRSVQQSYLQCNYVLVPALTLQERQLLEPKEPLQLE